MREQDSQGSAETLSIENRVVRPGQCLVIAEIGQAHDGSLGLAHAYVDSIARAGADAVKFQTHIAAAESTPSEPWRVPLSGQDHSRYEYWERTEFSVEQWRGLREHAVDLGLMFLSSPFSRQAAELLGSVGVGAWKVASGELSHRFLVDYLIDTGLPMLLSTGLSSLHELDDIVRRLRVHGTEFAVLQCASRYPCPPEKVGLNVLGEIHSRYNCPVGLSDHSGTIFPGLAAVVLGAAVIEVHVTLSREMYGPDVASSITTRELQQLVEGVRFLETVVNNPVDKDAASAELHATRAMFTRSVVAGRDLPAGTIIEEADLVLKKPGTGVPIERFAEVIGRTTRHDVAKDELLDWDDLA